MPTAAPRSCCAPRSTTTGTSTGTRSQRSDEARLVEDGAPAGPPAAEVDPARRPDLHPDPGRLRRDAATPAGGRSRTAARTSARSRPDTTDVGKLMLMEFALVYANDWFVVPGRSRSARSREVQGHRRHERLRRAAVGRAGAPAAGAEGWQRWSMFALSRRPGRRRRRAELGAAAGGAQGAGGRAARGGLARPRRDGQHGLGDRAAGAAAVAAGRAPVARPRTSCAPTCRGSSDRPPGRRPTPAAPIRYQVDDLGTRAVAARSSPCMSTAASRETQLQRAAMLRFLDGDPRTPEKVRPRTPLMSQNLPAAYFVAEEEVPRAGSPDQPVLPAHAGTGRLGRRLVRRAQGTGRGEGSSGLSFDRIVDSPTS